MRGPRANATVLQHNTSWLLAAIPMQRRSSLPAPLPAQLAWPLYNTLPCPVPLLLLCLHAHIPPIAPSLGRPPSHPPALLACWQWQEGAAGCMPCLPTLLPWGRQDLACHRSPPFPPLRVGCGAWYSLTRIECRPPPTYHVLHQALLPQPCTLVVELPPCSPPPLPQPASTGPPCRGTLPHPQGSRPPYNLPPGLIVSCCCTLSVFSPTTSPPPLAAFRPCNCRCCGIKRWHAGCCVLSSFLPSLFFLFSPTLPPNAPTPFPLLSLAAATDPSCPHLPRCDWFWQMCSLPPPAWPAPAPPALAPSLLPHVCLGCGARRSVVGRVCLPPLLFRLALLVSVGQYIRALTYCKRFLHKGSAHAADPAGSGASNPGWQVNATGECALLAAGWPAVLQTGGTQGVGRRPLVRDHLPRLVQVVQLWAHPPVGGKLSAVPRCWVMSCGRACCHRCRCCSRQAWLLPPASASRGAARRHGRQAVPDGWPGCCMRERMRLVGYIMLLHCLACCAGAHCAALQSCRTSRHPHWQKLQRGARTCRLR